MRGTDGNFGGTSASDTIAAIATPPGRGGVGVVRVSGAGVSAVIAGVVQRQLAARSATLAAFKGAHGEVLDQGIALHFPGPHSYTGEDVLELHGHGGPMVLGLLLGRCIELGARLAQPGEFTQRAFLNGKLDLAQAEGVADLIAAATATAARAAVRSLSGAFSREIRALVDALIELRMYTEAALDFPDEDVEFLRAADVRGRVAAILARVTGVLARAKQGALLREGLAVVLVGRPNVGKSSLLNQLAGDAVAIVTPIAGTTRDAVQSQIEIRGIPLTIVDTAGLRPTDDPIETLGIERTWAAVARADLALVLVDANAGGSIADEDTAILAQIPGALPRLVVHNKIDLAGLAPKVEARSVPERQGRTGLGGAPCLPVREDGCRRRAAAAGDPRSRRSARGHGGDLPRARAPSRRIARRGHATRGGGAARRRREAAAGVAGRGSARGTHGAGGDHRRIHGG